MIDQILQRLSPFTDQLFLLASFYDNLLDGKRFSTYARGHTGIFRTPLVSTAEKDYDMNLHASPLYSFEGFYTNGTRSPREGRRIYLQQKNQLEGSAGILYHEINGGKFEKEYITPAGLIVKRVLVDSLVCLGEWEVELELLGEKYEDLLPSIIKKISGSG